MPLGNPVLLASGRVGRQVAINRSDKPVYTDAQDKLVCCHGERASSIMAWLALERSDPDYKRPSVCDCANIDGLLTEYPHSSAPDSPPDPNLSLPLYKLLGVLGAEEKTIHSRPQRKALGSGESEVWVQPSGTLVCTHGNTRKMLARMAADSTTRFKSKSVQRCHCKIAVPRRIGSVFVPSPKATSRAQSGSAGVAQAETLGGGAVAEVRNEVVVGPAT